LEVEDAMLDIDRVIVPDRLNQTTLASYGLVGATTFSPERA
jgi:hypothetical protein